MSTLHDDYQALVARFETGKPADPTKNMSPEDAAKWKAMNEDHRDKFKGAAGAKYPEVVKELRADRDRGAIGTTEFNDLFRQVQKAPSAAAANKVVSQARKQRTAGTDPFRALVALDLELTASEIPGVRLDKDAAALEEMARLATLDLVADQMVGRTILEQMGGARRLQVMLGVQKFILLNDGVAFKWPNKQPSNGNYVEIHLTPMDTYTMSFFMVSMRGGGTKNLVKKYDDVYAEDLVHIFEKQTGWYLRMASEQAHLLVQAATRTGGEGDEQTAKFEEGKPADPTENMSPEDAKKWRLEHLKNKDNFKGASMSEAEATEALEDIVGRDGGFRMLRIWKAVQNLGTRYDRDLDPKRYDPVRNFISRARREGFKDPAIKLYVEEIQGQSLPKDWKKLGGFDPGNQYQVSYGGKSITVSAPSNYEAQQIGARKLHVSPYQVEVELVGSHGQSYRWGYEEGSRVPDGWDNGHVEDDPKDTESSEGSDTPDGSGNQGKRAVGETVNLYALVLNGGLLGATDNWGDARTWSYWSYGDRKLVADEARDQAVLMELYNVPIPLAEKLADVGTRASNLTPQAAFRLAKPFVKGQGHKLATEEEEDKTAASGKMPAATLRQATKLLTDLAHQMMEKGLTSPFYAAFRIPLDNRSIQRLPEELSQFDTAEKLRVLKMYLADDDHALAALVDPILKLVQPFSRTAASGLYGHTRRIQSDCDSCVRKVQRSAVRIAKMAYRRNEKVAEFLSVHSKRADSLPAKILVSALQGLGPKVGTQMRLAELRSDKEAADNVQKVYNAFKEAFPRHVPGKVYPASKMPEVVKWLKSQTKDKDTAEKVFDLIFKGTESGTFDKHWGKSASILDRIGSTPVELVVIAPEGVHFAKVIEEAEDLAKKGYITFDGVKVAKVTDGDAQSDEGIKQTTDKSAARNYSLYGFPEKVASLGLQACSDLRHEAGRHAYNLHSRRMEHHAAITDFFRQHSKQARCMYSKLLASSYPEYAKAASQAPRTVQGWLEWED